MANAVSKEEVKNFLILFRKEFEARIAAKYATFPAVNTVKGDLDTLEDKVADIKLLGQRIVPKALVPLEDIFAD